MSTPTILHIWSGSTTDPETARRMAVAQKTWKRELAQYPGWSSMDLSDSGLFPRNATSIGDTVPLPFIHDMVNWALEHSKADIIVITNADIGLYRGFAQECSDLCTAHGSCFAHRWDFPSLTAPLSSKEDIGKGKFYVGADAFAFTRQWWHDHHAELPPFVLGRETWDWIMRELIKLTGGAEMKQAIFHEAHASAWKKGRLYQPGNVYNRSYARAWLQQHKMGLREITNAPFNKVEWPPVKWVQKPAGPRLGSIDVLITLGRGSKWGNTELRYCLRALEKHAKNMDRIWVAGYDPGFLSKEVNFVPLEDSAHNKEARIAETILAVCEKGDISENFLWINDDTFLVEDTDIANYPYYADGLLEPKARRTRMGGYRVALAQTDAQLRAKDLPTHNFEIHVPIRYNRTKFAAMKPWVVLSGRCPLGMTFRSIYCNVLQIPPDHQFKDNKVGAAATAEEMAALVKGRPVFSIGDGLSDEAKGYLHNLFPTPSKYEIT